jgi:hypothetical protein
MGKLEGKRPLGIPRHRWEDISRKDLAGRVYCVDWLDLAQDRDM